MLLYDYWRSSAAFRVRIALELKDITVERRFIHLVRNGGEHRRIDYRAINPQGLVPALELDDGAILTQSLAIIEYLDAVKPEPALLPEEPLLAARARAVALAICCDIHPLANLRVADYLQEKLGVSAPVVADWRRHWVTTGLTAIEALIEPGEFCFGASPTLADLCLAPQLYSAERWGVSLEPYPKIRAVGVNYEMHPAFLAAHPSRQPDAA